MLMKYGYKVYFKADGVLLLQKHIVIMRHAPNQKKTMYL